jgi:hypothetical protein
MNTLRVHEAQVFCANKVSKKHPDGQCKPKKRLGLAAEWEFEGLNGKGGERLPQALDLVIVEKRIGTHDGNAQQLSLSH